MDLQQTRFSLLDVLFLLATVAFLLAFQRGAVDWDNPLDVAGFIIFNAMLVTVALLVFMRRKK